MHAGIDGYCGITNASTFAFAGCDSRISPTERAHSTVRACEKYIFRLAPISIEVVILESFVGADFGDLLGRRALLVERVGQPFLGQATCQLNADNALTHAENLRVVREHGALDRERVVSGHCANTADL